MRQTGQIKSNQANYYPHYALKKKKIVCLSCTNKDYYYTTAHKLYFCGNVENYKYI